VTGRACRIVVRGYELDSFGHVNNAVYLNYMEQARWELLRDAGTLDHFRDNGVFLVVTEVSVRYVKEARVFDALLVRTRVAREAPYVVFHHEIDGEGTGRTVARGWARTLLVDRERVPCDFPEELFRRIEGAAEV